jgi:hypothetical protein
MQKSEQIERRRWFNFGERIQQPVTPGRGVESRHTRQIEDAKLASILRWHAARAWHGASGAGSTGSSISALPAEFLDDLTVP